MHWSRSRNCDNYRKGVKSLKRGLKVGHRAEFDVVVDESMFPSFDGNVVHPVMSTVTMIYYMEKSGRKILLPYLEEQEEGAGFAINVKHLNPAVVGQKVRFRAECIKATARELICEVVAETGTHLIGKGIFTQKIFLKKKLNQKISKLTSEIGNK